MLTARPSSKLGNVKKVGEAAQSILRSEYGIITNEVALTFAFIFASQRFLWFSEESLGSDISDRCSRGSNRL